MGGNGEQPLPSKTMAPPPLLPTITLPQRTSMESLFNGGTTGGAFGFSPGPMTLVSSFFADNDDCKSFSQLLAGASASRVTGPANWFLQAEQKDSGEGGGFKQNKPSGLAIAQSPEFTVTPGLSPAGLLDSPGFFSPCQGPFGMTHQLVLSQVTAQATQVHSDMHIQSNHSSPASAVPAFTSNITQLPISMPESKAATRGSLDISHSEQRLQSSSMSVDKPADDGFNWRKYGQKQMKGGEFPRSYYKCTYPNCPVKKKVERSHEGYVTEIIYKGQHNHEPPQPNKRGRETLNSNEISIMQGNPDAAYQNGLKEGMNEIYPESSQATAEHLSGTSDSEEVDDHETEVGEKNDEPDSKRRIAEVRVSDPALSQRTVTEPRIIVQTTSEVDLLDDGYRWRKYGQKVVKGNPYPRSYYKCTTAGCSVRKHVERASTDPKAVITTYEGKHNHNVPAAKTSSHTIANNMASQLQSHSAVAEQHTFSSRDLGNNDQQPVACLRLKEEQIT